MGNVLAACSKIKNAKLADEMENIARTKYSVTCLLRVLQFRPFNYCLVFHHIHHVPTQKNDFSFTEGNKEEGRNGVIPKAVVLHLGSALVILCGRFAFLRRWQLLFWSPEDLEVQNPPWHISLTP